MADASLSVLVPVEITDAVLSSTNVAETDYSAWSNVTTYAVGDRVISVSTHMVYESAKASNLNKDPTDIANRTGTTIWWVEVSPTNAWKMFDGESTSQTIAAAPITVVLEPGPINSIYAAKLTADTAVVTIKDVAGGTEVYSETIILEDSAPPDYYEYFYSPYHQQPDFLLTDLPPYGQCEVTVSLTGSGNLACGMFQVGDLRPLGVTQTGAKTIPKTYSYIGIDDFGNNEIKRRKSAKDVALSAKIAPGEENTALDIIGSVLDIPVLWVAAALPDLSGLRIFGLGSGDLSYNNDQPTILNVNIKGLI